MMIWIDAQLSPAIAIWIVEEFGIDARPLRDLGLRDSEDEEIFQSARKADAVVMTKDSDFVLLLERYGPPPKIILLTCGNTSNERIKQILRTSLKNVLNLMANGEDLVEIY